MEIVLAGRVFNSRSNNRQYKTYPGPLGCAQDKLRRRSENRTWVGIFAIVVMLTVCGAMAEAKQAEKIPKIGWLTSGSPIGTDMRSEFLRRELNKLGYIEGKNLTVEVRSTEGKTDRLPGWWTSWYVSRLI